MYVFRSWLLTMAAAVCILSLLPGRSSAPRDEKHPAAVPSASPATGLILQESEGERRVQRPPPSGVAALATPFIIKVDRKNGGSPDLVMLYRDVEPGQAIAPPPPLRWRDSLYPPGTWAGFARIARGSRHRRSDHLHPAGHPRHTPEYRHGAAHHGRHFRQAGIRGVSSGCLGASGEARATALGRGAIRHSRAAPGTRGVRQAIGALSVRPTCGPEDRRREEGHLYGWPSS